MPPTEIERCICAEDHQEHSTPTLSKSLSWVWRWCWDLDLAGMKVLPGDKMSPSVLLPFASKSLNITRAGIQGKTVVGGTFFDLVSCHPRSDF